MTRLRIPTILLSLILGHATTALWAEGSREPPKAGARRVFEIAGLEVPFRFIPPGEDVLGSDRSDPCRNEDEKAWKARFSTGFWLAETELTREQWHALTGRWVGSRRCPTCPIDTMSWEQIQEFIAKLNRTAAGARYRLPTEAEWEYAARAGSDGPFPVRCRGYGRRSCPPIPTVTSLEELAELMSSTNPRRVKIPRGLDEIGWHSENCENGAQPVGGKPPNAWGLLDMHGNVAEWCEDIYGRYPKRPTTDRLRTTGRGRKRVIRGGSCFGSPLELRSAARNSGSPNHRLGLVGFRLVRELAVEEEPGESGEVVGKVD